MSIKKLENGKWVDAEPIPFKKGKFWQTLDAIKRQLKAVIN